MKINRFTLLLLLVALWGGLQRVEGQNLSSFKQQLAQPTIDTLSGRTASVTLAEDPQARAALAQSRPLGAKWRVSGWRICIFSDNAADARSRAHEAIALFENHYPSTPIYDEYASPYFRVSVGNCLTSEEAIILLQQVKPLFPKAFIKQEQLTLNDLLK